jgi:type I restriction enzyme S subunit
MSFPRYPKYKDSGVEWLGEVPEGWEVQKVKHLVLSIEQGWSPQCEGAPAQEDEWGVLKVGCVNGGIFDPTENKLLPSEMEPDSKLAVAAGDLMISRANTRELVGSAAVAERYYPKLMICDKLYRLRFRPSHCSPRFVSYYLGCDAVRGQIELSATGASSSMLNIGQSTILDLSIAAPPFENQLSIVEFLGRELQKIEELVAEQQRLMELLKEKRQAVISHAVTKGLNPRAPMKPSGIEWLGDVPEHWEVKPLKYLMSLTSGGTPNKENLAYWDGNVPWASSKDLKSDELFDTQDHITQKALDDGAADLVPPGSILTVVRGMILLHTFPVVVARVPMAINQDLKAILPTASVDAEFLAWLLRGASDEVLSRTDEAGHGTKVLRMETWLAMPTPVPPLKEQVLITANIIKQLGELDALAAEAQKAIDLLQERRTALISAAVTGQIDVRKLAAA